MRRPLALLVTLLLSLFALARSLSGADVKTALLAWEAVPPRTDVQRVATELVTLAQAELSAVPGFAWVERDELGKLLAEADLAASGHLDPRASLRVGKLARAELIVTGRLDASDPSASTLTLEAVDLERGDLLASRATSLPPRPHKHHTMRDTDHEAVVTALRALLAEAESRRRELEAKPAAAFLFLANTGPSSRLDEAGRRLLDSLRASGEEAGVRVLRFPRADEADDEHELAILGLAEADDQAWRAVADLYVWGEYKELPADGVPFADTPVEAALTIWDGASEPRVVPWSGSAAAFPSAANAFLDALRPSFRKAPSADPDARAAAARRLAAHADTLKKSREAAPDPAAFHASELGKNERAYRARLLETAVFLDPAAPAPRRALHETRWNHFATPPGGYSPEQLWRQYDGLVSLRDRNAAAARPIFDTDRARRTGLLEQIIRSYGRDLRGDNRLVYPRMLHAARLWAEEQSAAVAAATSPRGGGLPLLQFSLRTVAGDGPLVEPDINPTEVGAHVLHVMIDGAWPAVALALAEEYRRDPKSAQIAASRILDVYRHVGQEDIAHARIAAAIDRPREPDKAPDPMDMREKFAVIAESAGDLRLLGFQSSRSGDRSSLTLNLISPHATSDADNDRMAEAVRTRFRAAKLGYEDITVNIGSDPKAPPVLNENGMPPDPPAVAPEWGAAEAAAAATPGALTDLDRPLPLVARPLHAWFFAGDFPSDLFRRSYKQWPLNHRLTPPGFTRLLGFDGDHLLIDGLPLEAALDTEAPPFRLTAYSPYSRTFTGLGARFPDGSRFFAAHFGSDQAWLATDFDGVFELGPTPGSARLLTPEDGLPSRKLAALAAFPGGVAVAAAPPERAIAYLTPGSEKWLALTPPAVPDDRPSAGGRSGKPPPRLAGAGRWLLHADARPGLYDTAARRWSDALVRYQAARADLHRRVRADVTDRIAAASAAGDTATLSTLTPRLRAVPDWALDAPNAVVGDGEVFWLAGSYGLVRLDPERPDQAHRENCPPVLAMADAGPWLWIAFMPAENSAPPPMPGHDRSVLEEADPHVAPHPYNEPPEWRRSRLALFDKASRRWLGSIEVEGGILSLASAPGRLWAAGSDLYEFDTTALPTGSPAETTGFLTRWTGARAHPAHRAITRHDSDTLSALLSADPSLALDTSASGWTPLHAAAAAGNSDAIKLLLDASPQMADLINAFTAEGASPLALAAAAGDADGVRLLLAAGADASGQLDPPPRHEPLEFGESAEPLPAVSPPQPEHLTAELLPDGGVRLKWSMEPGPFDGFVIYRRDLDQLRQQGTATRWDTVTSDDDGRWDYLGTFAALVGPKVREWTDRDLRSSTTRYRYTVIAVNPHDRFGPRTPTAGASRTAPELRAPPFRVLACSPARLSPTPLHFAAAAGRTELVSLLLDAGADPAARDLGGYTPHHAALLAGHFEAARVLLTRGAPINARQPRPANSNYGFATAAAFQQPRHAAPAGERPVRGAGTALSLVYEARADRAFFEQLLADGADPLLGPDGPLAVRAAYLGRRDEVERFLALAPHPFVTDIYDRTAFVAALAAKRFALARDLRERCFAPGDPRWPIAKAQRIGETALRIATELNDDEMLGWLIKRGAAPDGFGWNRLLELAIKNGNVNTARLLVAAGAQVQSMPLSLRNGIREPELLALLKGRPTSVSSPSTPGPESANPRPTTFPRFLVHPYSPYRRHLYSPRPDNAWATPSTSQSQHAQDTKLLAAAEAGDAPVIKAALAAGARIDATDEKLWTPLIHAINAGHLEAARTLIDHGASLHRLTRYGSTPLGFACSLPDLTLARELLDLGADPNLVDPILPGASPLVSHMNRRPDSARLLLARGADPRVIVESHGRGGALPPVFLAAARGELAVVKMLVAAGADPTAVLWREGGGDELLRGQTALHSAAASDNIETLEYFLSLGLDPAQTDGLGDNALDRALLVDAHRTAARLRQLGVKSRRESAQPPSAGR